MCLHFFQKQWTETLMCGLGGRRGRAYFRGTPPWSLGREPVSMSSLGGCLIVRQTQYLLVAGPRGRPFCGILRESPSLWHPVWTRRRWGFCSYWGAPSSSSFTGPCPPHRCHDNHQQFTWPLPLHDFTAFSTRPGSAPCSKKPRPLISWTNERVALTSQLPSSSRGPRGGWGGEGCRRRPSAHRLPATRGPGPQAHKHGEASPPLRTAKGLHEPRRPPPPPPRGISQLNILPPPRPCLWALTSGRELRQVRPNHFPLWGH